MCADVAERIEVAAKGGAWAAFLNAGQVCTSAERFYVLEPVYDDFVPAFVEYTSSPRVGDPLDPQTDVGPLVSARQRERVAAHVDGALAAGAELVTGGDRAGHERGHFYAPAVVTGAPAETDLLSEETFGPVAPIVPVEHARRGDRARQLDALRPRLQRVYEGSRLDRALHARDQGGHPLVQRPPHRQRRRPLRGMKQSGLGRELGQEGLEAFQETKHVHLETELAPKSWWYPYGNAATKGA